MIINTIENQFSIQPSGCHSNRTAFSSMRWNGPTGGCSPREDISHKYIPASPVPALTPRQGLSRCAFQGLFFAGVRIVEMSSRRLRRVASQAGQAYQKRIWYLSRKTHPFKAQSQRTSAPESRFDTLILTGFSGGFVEVAYAGK